MPGSSYAESCDIVRQLELMGASNIVINSDMQLRKDGMPYPRQRVSDTGVCVYFTLKGKQQCIPCDRWVKVEENLRAISKTIDALRGIERWGAKEMVDAAFSGFKALPASSSMAQFNETWFEILGVLDNASAAEIKRAYRSLCHTHHPDKGGESATFNKITRAYEEGMEQYD